MFEFKTIIFFKIEQFIPLFIPILLFSACTTVSQQQEQSAATVRIAGAMRNVMMKGELQGTIDLDTISDKNHLYGLGPMEYLRGELLIVDGEAWQSSVESDSTMKVQSNWKVKAPFFVYSNVAEWEAFQLPDSIKTSKQLEGFLDVITKNTSRPFTFKIKGTVTSADIHIVDLPEGSSVSSPQEAHQGLQNYHLEEVPCEILGFFSTEHQAVFTHHDSYVHMHLITDDHFWMGHLDTVEFGKGSLLYLSKK